MQEAKVQSLGWKDPLEKEMATPSSILAWEIPWTEELIVHGITRVRYDLVTKQHFFSSYIGKNPWIKFMCDLFLI